jgi:thiamine-phosphate pyrophosphorylase
LPALPHPPFLCVVTDDDLSADQTVAAVDSACAAGPLVVQLRARKRFGAELFDLAMRLRATTSEHGSLLIVNDRLDVALAARADGVHLPGKGIPSGRVREVIERRREQRGRLLVGLSIHSVDEIRANAAYVDYFQFGPVFATPSKAAFGPPQGCAALARAVKESAAAGRACVGVGGIDATNADSVIDAGAAGVAVIRAVMRANDPEAAARTLLAVLTRKRG